MRTIQSLVFVVTCILVIGIHTPVLADSATTNAISHRSSNGYLALATPTATPSPALHERSTATPTATPGATTTPAPVVSQTPMLTPTATEVPTTTAAPSQTPSQVPTQSATPSATQTPATSPSPCIEPPFVEPEDPEEEFFKPFFYSPEVNEESQTGTVPVRDTYEDLPGTLAADIEACRDDAGEFAPGNVCRHQSRGMDRCLTERGWSTSYFLITVEKLCRAAKVCPVLYSNWDDYWYYDDFFGHAFVVVEPRGHEAVVVNNDGNLGVNFDINGDGQLYFTDGFATGDDPMSNIPEQDPELTEADPNTDLSVDDPRWQPDGDVECRMVSARIWRFPSFEAVFESCAD